MASGGGGASGYPALDNADLSAIFWDALPSNVEEHPDYIAMQAIEEEMTPEERADSLKARPPGDEPPPPAAARRPLAAPHARFGPDEFDARQLLSLTVTRRAALRCARGGGLPQPPPAADTRTPPPPEQHTPARECRGRATTSCGWG